MSTEALLAWIIAGLAGVAALEVLTIAILVSLRRRPPR